MVGGVGYEPVTASVDTTVGRFQCSCYIPWGDARRNKMGRAMDPTTSFSPSDGPELPWFIDVYKEWVTGSISILPVVEIRET